jgi:hypothetical protein
MHARDIPDLVQFLVEIVCTCSTQQNSANSTILAEVLDHPADQAVYLGKND